MKDELVTKVKFDIGDIVYGFPDNELHKLKINRIEISIERFGYSIKDGITNHKVIYLATPIDEPGLSQSRFKENQLFTKEGLIDYINNYFKNN